MSAFFVNMVFGAPMNEAPLLLYLSSNGDRWWLAKGHNRDDVYVRHDANAASGGRVTYISIGRFLTEAPVGPQHLELVRLIGSLVDLPRHASPIGGPAPDAGAAAAEPTPGEVPHSA